MSPGGGARRRREALTEYVRKSLWVLPAVAVLLALGVGSLLSLVPVSSRSPLQHIVFQGTVDDARTLLIGIAGTMITVIALVLGLTAVALQLTSSQYSPRLLRNFLRDRQNQIALSVFVATFAYATAGLYTVGVSSGTRTAGYPRMAVTWAILLLFASLFALIYFIHHLAHSMRIDTIITVAQRNTEDTIDHLPDSGETGPPGVPDDAVLLSAHRSGYVQSVHPKELHAAAVATSTTVRLVPRVGDYVVAGSPLAWYRTEDGRAPRPEAEERLRPLLPDAVLVGGERTMLQDAGFGIRQLVDVAIKALSPAVNDPYTAVMSVDRLSALLVALVRHPLGDLVLRDPDGTVRVTAPFPAFADYAALACDQIRRYGASEPQVSAALLRLLRLTGQSTADPHRRAVLAAHVRLVLADAERETRQHADIDALQTEGNLLLTELLPADA